MQKNTEGNFDILLTNEMYHSPSWETDSDSVLNFFVKVSKVRG